jgi:hypothetical protein
MRLRKIVTLTYTAEAQYAGSLYVLMNDFRFIATLLMMQDVLPLMKKMSLELQRSCPDFAVLMVLVPDIIQQVEDMITVPGKEYKKIDTAIKCLASEGHDVRYGSDLHRRVFEECRKDFLKALVAHLKERFKEMPVVGSLCRLFTPRLYKGRSLAAAAVQRCPRLQKSRLLLDEVAQHFCISGVASSMKNEELEAEWKSLIKMVWEFRDDTVDVEVPDEGEEGEEESGEEEGVEDGEEEPAEVAIDQRTLFDQLFDKPRRRKKKVKIVKKPLEAKDLIAEIANMYSVRYPSYANTCFPLFVYLMRVYLVVIISTAEFLTSQAD